MPIKFNGSNNEVIDLFGDKNSFIESHKIQYKNFKEIEDYLFE